MTWIPVRPENTWKHETTRVNASPLKKPDRHPFFGRICSLEHKSGLMRGEIISLQNESLSPAQAVLVVQQTPRRIRDARYPTLKHKGKSVTNSNASGKSKQRLIPIHRLTHLIAICTERLRINPAELHSD